MTAYFRTVSASLLLFSASSLFLACGGSSGSDEPLVRAEGSSTALRNGEVLTLQFFTNDFNLNQPVGVAPRSGDQFVGSLLRSLSVFHDDDTSAAHHEEEVVETHEADIHVHDDGTEHDHSLEEAEAEESDIHVHDDGTEHDHNAAAASNPFATEGHVHIYLDGGSGSEAHITSWAYETPVVLPDNLAPGMHSLRIELRDNTHVPVGGEHDQFVFFEVVG